MAKAAIFEDSFPSKYKSWRGDAITLENGQKGHYLLFGNKQHHVLGLVVSIPGADAHYLFNNWLKITDMNRLSHHLFKHYVGLQKASICRQDRNKYRVAGQKMAINRILVQFSSRFIEPDIITKLRYKDGRQVIVVMGHPHVGYVTDNNPAFASSFDLMEKEMLDLIENTVLKNNLDRSVSRKERLKRVFNPPKKCD